MQQADSSSHFHSKHYVPLLQNEPPMPNTSNSPQAPGSRFWAIKLSGSLGQCSSPELALQTRSDPWAPPVSVRAPSSGLGSPGVLPASSVLAGAVNWLHLWTPGSGLGIVTQPHVTTPGTLPDHIFVLGPSQPLLSGLVNIGAFKMGVCWPSFLSFLQARPEFSAPCPPHTHTPPPHTPHCSSLASLCPQIMTHNKLPTHTREDQPLLLWASQLC